MGVLSDGKRDSKHRAAAAEGLNMLGDPSAMPVLLQLAKTQFLTPGQEQGRDAGARRHQSNARGVRGHPVFAAHR
jgi:hypothetical protein